MLKKIEEYISSRILLLKIEGTEKVSQALAVLFRRIILLMLAGSFLLFISVAIALWIGDMAESNVIGFLSLGGIYLIIFIITFIFRKSLLEKNIKNEVVRVAFEEPEKQENHGNDK
jgi:hypothetical protein